MMHKSRRRGTKRSGKNRKNKNRGGMFKSNSAPAVAEAAAEAAAEAGTSESSVSVLRQLPGGVARRLDALTVPDSGVSKFLSYKLLEPPSGMPLPPRHISESMSRAIDGARKKWFRNELFRSAEHLHATSFDSQAVDTCARLNVRAVEQLKKAIALGSLPARACLADMLLTGNTFGVDANFDEAVDLVSQFDNVDPDCQGVLAHCYFNIAKLNDARSLAAPSAGHGSKYGQFVLGLLERKPKEAFKQFALAAAQNYDEAQLALSALCMRGYADIPPDRDEALRLLRLAARQGNRRAFQRLEWMDS